MTDASPRRIWAALNRPVYSWIELTIIVFIADLIVTVLR